MGARSKVPAVTAAAVSALLGAAGTAGGGDSVSTGILTSAPTRHAARSAAPPSAAATPSSATTRSSATTPSSAAATPVPASRPATATAPPGPPSSAWCLRAHGLACYSPRQIERAYDLPSLYASGLDGRGRTIVVVDSFGSPTIRHDVQVFDQGTGLPAPPSLRVLQPVGKVPPYNPHNQDMVNSAGETTTDVEAAHAIAPGASILLVETPVAETLTGGGFAQFMAAENFVVGHDLGDVVSQSFGIPEQNFPSRAAILRLRYAYLSAYRHHVTVLAAANDFGVTGPTKAGGMFRTQPVVDWPASDPLVTGVGGTRLRLAANGSRLAPDSAWNESGSAVAARYAGALPWASSGGASVIFTRPPYQNPVRTVVANRRGVPDVALSASFSGASITFESFTGPQGSWKIAAGTSVATPYFAGIVAIADQYLHARLGLVNPVLYRLERARAPGIVDVTQGSNTVSFSQGRKTVTVTGYPARPGYDLVTGVGSIDAARFVRGLRAPRPRTFCPPGHPDPLCGIQAPG